MLGGNTLHRTAMHVDHVQHRPAIAVELCKRAHPAGKLGAGGVGGGGHDRGDRRRGRPPAVAVVWQAKRHYQRPQVGIAQTQRAIVVTVAADSVTGIAGVIDQYLLGDDHDPCRHTQAIKVDGPVIEAELHQVQARQVAGRVVEEHILAARIGRADRAALRAGVPAIDGRVILHTRVAADMRALGDKAQQLAGLVLDHRLAGGDGIGLPVRVIQRRLHELVGHADGRVGVLEHYRTVGLTAE